MDLSLIIVSWNAKRFLRECLESIFAQRFSKTFEVIVVDNNSSDGSAEMVQAEFPQVVLLKNKENYGFAKANNIGIEHSSGKYLALVNSDVKVLEGCLTQMCDFMDRNPRIGISGPRILNADRSMQSSCRKFPSLWNNFCEAVGLDKVFKKYGCFSGEHMFYFPHNSVRHVNVLVGCFLVVRREAIKQVGLLDERFFIYAEDIDWCRRFWDSGWEIAFYPGGSAIHYRGGSSSNDPLRFSSEQLKAKFQYWKKHQGYSQVVCLSVILVFHYGIRALLETLHAAIGVLSRPGGKDKVHARFEALRGVWRIAAANLCSNTIPRS